MFDRNKPCGWAPLLARERSREATISANSSTVYLPLPTSTSVPTMARTILRRKRSARIVKRSVPSLSTTHSACVTLQIFVLLLEFSFANVVKSEVASNTFAASFIFATSNGI